MIKPVCDECPLFGQPRVPGTGMGGGLAIVGEAPGQQEVVKGMPFVGLSGQLLRETLMNVGIDPKTVWITNSCLCRPPQNATPTADAVVACNGRLLSELKQQRIKRVLVCGATALTALVPEFKKGITKARGSWFWHKELGCYVLPTFHPAAILRNPDYFPDFVQDLSMIARLPTKQITMPVVHYQVIENSSDLENMTDEVYFKLDPTHMSLDIETTGLDEFTDRILAIGIGADEKHIWVIPDTALKSKVFVRHLKEFLEDESLCWCGQNAYQFDAKFLEHRLGIDVTFKFDTMLAHYTLDERQNGHGLKDMARNYFQARDYAADLEKAEFETLDRGKLYQYLAYDVYYTWKLVPVLDEEMRREGVTHVHDNILLPGARALGQVEHNGVLVDVPYLAKLERGLDSEISAQLEELRRESDEPEFNPNSPKQVKQLLYGKLKLGPMSQGTDKETLENLNHPIGNMVLDLRLKTKLKSTYVKGLLEKADKNHRVHADFNLFGTVTGRLSSSHPNLQNIPLLVGPMIRDAFIASPGWTLVEADYSQLELRVSAYFSHDEKLIETYMNDWDIHRQVASEVFNVPPEEVTHDQRYVAKYIDFGILYGRQAPSLAYGELKCSVKQAQAYIDRFLGRYLGMAKWMKKVQKEAVMTGVIETAFGRKRRFPLVLPSNKGDIERQAVNSPIQGTASDICLGALIRLQERLDPSTVRILLTVHDSILLEVREEALEDTLPVIFEEMENHIPLDSPVPFKIDVKTGERWGSLKETGKDREIRVPIAENT